MREEEELKKFIVDSTKRSQAAESATGSKVGSKVKAEPVIDRRKGVPNKTVIVSN